MKKTAALQAYVRFVKTATAAAKLLDSGASGELPPELRGAGVGALAGGIPAAVLGGLVGGDGLNARNLKQRLLMAALMGGAGALGGGLLGAGAGALGRAATDPEDEDRLTGGSPVARGALLGATGLGGLGAGMGASRLLGKSLFGVRGPASLGRKLRGGAVAAAALGIPAALLGGGLGAGAGALRQSLFKDEED